MSPQHYYPKHLTQVIRSGYSLKEWKRWPDGDVFYRKSCVHSCYFLFSQKDLESLKAEVQRRQQLQELGKSEEPIEDGPLELEDKIPID